jgi:hypothetical protein
MDVGPGEPAGLGEAPQFTKVGALLPGIADELVRAEHRFVVEFLTLAADGDRRHATRHP